MKNVLRLMILCIVLAGMTVFAQGTLTTGSIAGDVVDEASLNLMIPGPEGHGFGLDRLAGMGSNEVIGQIGSKPEYSAILAIWPAEQTVAVVFVNDLEFIIDPVAVQLRDIATGH